MIDVLLYRNGEHLPPHFYFQAEAAMRIIFEESEGEELSLQPDPQRMYVVIAEGVKLIAHAAIVCTMLEHQGMAYKCYGLSGVFTFPAYRKKGYGGQLIEAATNLIREDAAADIALLWTANHNVPFYTQHAWEPMPHMQTFVGDPAQPTLYNDENRLMLFLSEKGKQGLPTFEHGQVYVGEESW